ncbi:MAG: elongation factor P, partial [Bacilli bacterium]|nr:elongation factor P [Bacilli bacterium]
MFNVNDIKNGITFLYEGSIYQVIEFLHVKPGKGPAFLRTKLKNLRTGATIEKTFNTNIKLEKAMIEKQSVQFLYSTGDTYTFMNMETYEQVELNK